MEVGPHDEGRSVHDVGHSGITRDYRGLLFRHQSHPSMTQVPKREFWNNAEPERLPDQWRMTFLKYADSVEES